jgi:putative ABC transport system ATP-binding protein
VRRVEVRGVTLAFGSGSARMRALDHVDLTLQGGVLNVVAGPSGSGKTSLLSIMGAMIAPDAGAIVVDDADIAALDAAARSAFRREKIGYVFQSFRLMPALNAEENIRLSLEVRRVADQQRRAQDALAQVGLAAKAHLRPDELSGGEKQRVAVARALAHGPAILLADEPTASLDTANGQQVIGLLAELARDEDRVVVVVTHDPRVISFAGRIIELQDGRVVRDEPRDEPRDVPCRA